MWVKEVVRLLDIGSFGVSRLLHDNVVVHWGGGNLFQVKSDGIGTSSDMDRLTPL